jgi:hypothetical protein
MTARTRGAAGLPSALILLAVSTALGAALLEVAHTQTVLSRMRRNTATALAAADGCLATVVARLPVGWGFADVLAAFDAGTVPVPAGCIVEARPAPDAGRLLLDVEGGAAGRRRLAAVVTRAAPPGPEALLWLARDSPPDDVGGTLALDGIDADHPPAPPVAAIAGPGPPEALDGWLVAQGAHVVVTAPDATPRWSPAPPLDEIDARAVAAGAAAGGTFVASGPPTPALTRLPADLVVDTPMLGAGVLVVRGRLDILSTFEFTGVVVAAEGVRVAGGASLAIRGALWVGPVDPAATILDIDGDVSVAASADALALADALLPLPRRARVAGVSDPG